MTTRRIAEAAAPPAESKVGPALENHADALLAVMLPVTISGAAYLARGRGGPGGARRATLRA